MKCQKCKSDKIAAVNGKCSDMCMVVYNGKEKDGYVPEGFGIGGGDYIVFQFCVSCGQIQGKFPQNPEGFNDDEEAEE